MCKECGKIFCPRSCPRYGNPKRDSLRLYGYCSICGDVLCADTRSFIIKSHGICEYCLKNLTISELMEECDVADISDITDMLGIKEI